MVRGLQHGDGMIAARPLLRATFVAIPVIAGLDKFFHLLTDWHRFLSPPAHAILGDYAHTFMRAVGVVEIGVGLLILFGWVRLGGYIAAAWLAAITVNLILAGFYSIALRDAGLAAAAFAMAQLAAAREPREERVERPAVGYPSRPEATR